MNRESIIVLTLLLATVPAMAESKLALVKRSIRHMIGDKEFQAKVPLFRVKVYPDGTIENDHDEEQIHPGQRFKVKRNNVAVVRGLVEVDVWNRIHRGEIARIRFYFDGPVNDDPSRTLDAFRRMWDMIAEPAELPAAHPPS